MDACFRQHWSLKEAFTKGRGDGLGFDFNKCEFTIEPFREAEHRGTAGQRVEVATVVAEGRPKPLWRFYVQHAGGDHWVSVSRGPPTDAVDASICILRICVRYRFLLQASRSHLGGQSSLPTSRNRSKQSDDEGILPTSTVWLCQSYAFGKIAYAFGRPRPGFNSLWWY